MSYEDLLAQIYAELPHLKGQLNAPKVVYVKAQGKVYITFESNVLVEEASFLKMERLLRRIEGGGAGARMPSELAARALKKAMEYVG